MSKYKYFRTFTMTHDVVNLVGSISEEIGKYEANLKSSKQNLHLRRNSRIKSIYSSTAIEDNSLSLQQVKDVIDGKLVMGKEKDIQEIKNAFNAYEKIRKYKPYSVKSLLFAHSIMTRYLVSSSGDFRRSNVEIKDKDKNILHVGMSPELLPKKMKKLLHFAKDTDLHPLIISSIVHFSIENIHPFADGNGRMGRLWQTVILMNWNEIFEYLPIETIVFKNQDKYYKALQKSERNEDCSYFIEFMLKSILTTIQNEQLSPQDTPQDTPQDETIQTLNKYPKLLELIEELSIHEKSTDELLIGLNLKDRKNLIATYLHPAAKFGLVEQTIPDKPTSRYQKYRLTKKGRSILENTAQQNNASLKE